MSEPKFGDRVRVQCTATGRYVVDGWALVVSAQDNDLFLDQVAAAAEPPPHPTLPVPSDDALHGASAVLLSPATIRERAKFYRLRTDPDIADEAAWKRRADR